MLTRLEERVYSNAKVSPAIARRLRLGLVVVFYDETLEVHALIELDRATGVWYGRPRFSTSRDLLPERAPASEKPAARYLSRGDVLCSPRDCCRLHRTYRAPQAQLHALTFRCIGGHG